MLGLNKINVDGGTRLKFFSVIFKYLNNIQVLRLELLKKFENSFSYLKNAFSLNPFISHRSFKKQNDFLSSNGKVFFTELVLIGLGFKVSVKNGSLRLNLGYSHVIFVLIPDFVFIIKRKSKLILYSLNKGILFNFATKLLNFRKLNVYKIKGLKQKNVIVKTKPGKRTK